MRTILLLVLLFSFLEFSDTPSVAGALVVGHHMETGRPVPAPKGYMDFCKKNPEPCEPSGKRMVIHKTPARMRELYDALMRAKYGMWSKREYAGSDVWQSDGNSGDCEDKALRLQALLKKDGWPTDMLLLVHIDSPYWIGVTHLALVVTFKDEDVLLDTLLYAPEEKWWHPLLGYKYIKRQSRDDPRVWVALKDHGYKKPQ